MNRIAYFYVTLLLLAVSTALTAQVTIGKDKVPETFSILELSSTKGGLRHPQMNTSERDLLLQNIADKSGAHGLTIFNTDSKCLEFYKDDTEGWLNLCDEQDLRNIPLDMGTQLYPYTMAQGAVSTGTYGKQKFDVAQVYSGGSCGTLSAEAGRPGDFQSVDEFTRNYVIEFSSITGVTDLIVGKYQDPYGILETVSGNVKGNVTSQNNRVLVKFVNNINTLAKGTREHNALKATIYGVFKKDGVMKRIEYTITVMDCLGCGVTVGVDKYWLSAMCYNLGADETKNPLAYSAAIEGDSYQWGRLNDGHEKKDSDIYYPDVPLGKVDYSTVPLDELDADGRILTTSPRYGLFIPSSKDCQRYFFFDWSAEHSETIWGDGTQRLVVRAGKKDPCPKGFRLPTHNEIELINDALIVNDASKGALARSEGTLFLPYSSFRTRKGYESMEAKAQYWSSTIHLPPSGYDNSQIWTLELKNTNGTDKQITTNSRASSASVRCIAE